MSESNYYGNVNIDLLRWIPLDANRVLEVGCGEAALAAAYKIRNPMAEYVAVEAHPPAAAVACSRVDRLIAADFMAMDEAALDELGVFDAIILGDVLEHLADPWRALEILKSRLKSEGRMVLSVPNASHWTALANLMCGQWPAHDAGLFDRTHLRLFTPASLQTTLAESGLSVERSRPRIFVGNRKAAEQWIPILATAAEQAGQDRAAFVQRAQALQYIASAHHADFKPPERLHVHFAAFAPNFLDARTRVPAEALESDPDLNISYREKSTDLPNLPIEQPKVLVLQRLVVQEERSWRAYMARARASGWVVAYEIDDHPDLLGRIHPGGTMAGQIRAIVNRSHAVQTSTPRLAAALSALNPEVAVFENALMDLPRFNPRDRVRRVFYGALNREGFSQQIAATLAPSIDTNPDLDFLVIHDRAFFDALPTARKTFLPGQPYAAYLEAMASCDIVLSPLEGTDAELFKSDIKFLEAARCGAAMIASPCVYEDAIAEGRTGFIARNPAEWNAHLTRLTEDPALRNNIAHAAWTEVRDKRMMSLQVGARSRWYRDIYARRDALDRALIDRWPELAEAAAP